MRVVEMKYLVFVLILIAILAGALWAHKPDIHVHIIAHRVSAGETLWSIAKSYCLNDDPRMAIYEIRKANNLLGPDGPILQPGQIIYVPVKKEGEQCLSRASAR